MVGDLAGDAFADADAWLAHDLRLLRDADAFRPRVTRADLQVGSRREPDDPNLLFRWRLPVVNAPAAVVFEGFVHRLLDYHREWTREFVDGYVVAVPETTRPHAGPVPAVGGRVLYQRFNPGVPAVAPRDLCSAEVVRRLPGGVLQASYRSVDAVPVASAHQRIHWWGAVLCTPLDDTTSELVYLDRENQGGRFPARLMNQLMPRYLVTQAEHVRRFFAHGGPPELRT